MRIKEKFREFIKTFKTLQGDPHYIAMGMAIGVFVSITPTIPFHTALAIALAFIFNGSKPAAAIGVWFCNPITFPLFYIGSYKVGMFFVYGSKPLEIDYESVAELMQMGVDVTVAMILGGIILGIVPGIAAYFITRKMVVAVRSRSGKSVRSKQLTDS